MFPWESAWLDDGEVTPLYCGADIVTGKSSPVLTGMIEQHISADIAWGVWLYYQATGDDDFMNRRGCELLIEIARFWASRVSGRMIRSAMKSKTSSVRMSTKTTSITTPLQTI